MTVEVERMFREAGAILEGHFLLSSGLHSPIYWEKFRILQYPHYTEQLCHMIVEHFQRQRIQVVAGPTMGGIILAYEVARQLGVQCIFAEHEGEWRAFKRGSSITPGDRILVVDDILTTGSSIQQVMAEVRRYGGEVVGTGVLVDRSQGKAEFGVPLFSCHQASIPTYTPQDCPLCAARVPLLKPGGESIE
jgi:orotate phosphoribosyltransferase